MPSLPRRVRIAPLLSLALLAAAAPSVPAAVPAAVPAVPPDFPHFTVPGREREMEALRALYHLHYPGAHPQPTMWDEWLPGPALWPATGKDSDDFRAKWENALSTRIQDVDGYIASHQHISIAHKLGWPIPPWTWGTKAFGWHFSFQDTVPPPYRGDELASPDKWTLAHATSAGVSARGWDLGLTSPGASATSPVQNIDTFQCPFVQLRWWATGLESARPYIEWATARDPDFGPERRMYFPPASGDARTDQMIPLYTHPRWKGEVDRLRIGFDNATPGAKVTVQALFSTFDTRHNVNEASFIDGCATTFHWTGDINFLRANIDRMRKALRFVMREQHAGERKVVLTTWVGHDGETGLIPVPGKKPKPRPGHGVGSNYWDLLPFGHEDCYATMRYYGALGTMAQVEREIRRHPEWNVPVGALSFDPDALRKEAAAVKAAGNRRFWNAKTGRFVACIDDRGQAHDYGYTFLNTEAVARGFATPEHAKTIYAWLSGERTVPGDTSQGQDIYYWRFGPRSSTKRNTEWYTWWWSNPAGTPWGGQVQDGGAVLGFTYYDILARLALRGPEDAERRLDALSAWFGDVQAAGGYREYYKDHPGGATLQGGGAAGGIGVDVEFTESVLAPQVMLDGFLGFAPTGDGFRLAPKLPKDWPSLTIDRIRWHDLTLSITATKKDITVRKDGETDEPAYVVLPPGRWRLVKIAADGAVMADEAPERRRDDAAVIVSWSNAAAIRFERE